MVPTYILYDYDTSGKVRRASEYQTSIKLYLRCFLLKLLNNLDRHFIVAIGLIIIITPPETKVVIPT